MAAKKKPTKKVTRRVLAKAAPSEATIPARVKAILGSLERMSTQKDRDNLARFGITATNAFGVSMANLQKLAKQIGRDHQLAEALWQTRCYEAQMLTSFVDEPEKVTAAQMDRWCKDFDNWGIVDTLCFHLFDRTPLAFAKVKSWSKKSDEQGKRAAFALLACLALHGRGEGDAFYLESLKLIEAASTDERNFVKKGVSWALRSVGRRSLVVNAAAVKLARKLAASSDPTARWLGKDALRDITKPAVLRKLA